MQGRSLLGMSELLELRIMCVQSALCECKLAMNLLGLSRELGLENFPLFAAFLLLDVVHVGVAENAADTEKEEHIAIGEVVKSVGLVPCRELPDVLMG